MVDSSHQVLPASTPSGGYQRAEVLLLEHSEHKITSAYMGKNSDLAPFKWEDVPALLPVSLPSNLKLL